MEQDFTGGGYGWRSLGLGWQDLKNEQKPLHSTAMISKKYKSKYTIVTFSFESNVCLLLGAELVGLTRMKLMAMMTRVVS